MINLSFSSHRYKYENKNAFAMSIVHSTFAMNIIHPSPSSHPYTGPTPSPDETDA